MELWDGVSLKVPGARAAERQISGSSRGSPAGSAWSPPPPSPRDNMEVFRFLGSLLQGDPTISGSPIFVNPHMVRMKPGAWDLWRLGQ